MKTGDIAVVKKVKLNDDPFRRLSMEPITITGKVISVHYPSFTVKFDKPGPEGEEFQEFHVNHIPEAVTVKDGDLSTVLSVVLDIIDLAKPTIDPSQPGQAMNDLARVLMRIEDICKEYMGEEK